MKLELTKLQHIAVQLADYRLGLSASHEAYVHRWILPSLARASEYIAAQSRPGRELALVIVAAYRTPECQRAVEEYFYGSMGTPPNIGPQASSLLEAGDAQVPAHCTGGCVDAVVAVNGLVRAVDVSLSYEPAQYRWPPSAADTVAEAFWSAHDAAVLRTSMRAAGFVGVEFDHRHFEKFTHRWAKAFARRPLLRRVLDAPITRQEGTPRHAVGILDPQP